MSLYTNEEICGDCNYACIHQCCGRFCSCLNDSEEEKNYLRGTCKEHTNEKKR